MPLACCSAYCCVKDTQPPPQPKMFIPKTKHINMTCMYIKRYHSEVLMLVFDFGMQILAHSSSTHPSFLDNGLKTMSNKTNIWKWVGSNYFIPKVSLAVTVLVSL